MRLKNRTTHLMLMLPVSLVDEIEKYKEDHRIRTKHEAVRALINKGLKKSEE